MIFSSTPLMYFLKAARWNVALLIMVPLLISALTSQPLWGTIPFMAIAVMVVELSRTAGTESP
jgi:hypothetical protein